MRRSVADHLADFPEPQAAAPALPGNGDGADPEVLGNFLFGVELRQISDHG